MYSQCYYEQLYEQINSPHNCQITTNVSCSSIHVLKHSHEAIIVHSINK